MQSEETKAKEALIIANNQCRLDGSQELHIISLISHQNQTSKHRLEILG